MVVRQSRVAFCSIQDSQLFEWDPSTSGRPISSLSLPVQMLISHRNTQNVWASHDSIKLTHKMKHNQGFLPTCCQCTHMLAPATDCISSYDPRTPLQNIGIINAYPGGTGGFWINSSQKLSKGIWTSHFCKSHLSLKRSVMRATLLPHWLWLQLDLALLHLLEQLWALSRHSAGDFRAPSWGALCQGGGVPKITFRFDLSLAWLIGFSI